ncbi:hypothetical protein [Streptomyces sp. NPDC018031]|uniref:hypothetical protein n=1 Tax=Streptomyces sp. NPDC018031 TaxID=3365033 RepID=UPI00378A7872
MRRIGAVLASVIAAAALVVSSSGQAVAANGVLTIVPRSYENPSGCHNGQINPLIVINQTDQTATVYDGPDCQGEAIGSVPPGGASGTFEFGSSVSIP